MTRVSVIIPAYNAEEYIEKCLQALDNQSFRDFDVIIVDDCSADNTVEVIHSFAAKHDICIHTIKNEDNAGPSKARSRGIAFSQAEYIAFCDSDDWYEPDYLELMMREADKSHADMVFCNSRKVLMDGTVISGDTVRDMPRNMSVQDALVSGVDSLCALMVRKEIISRIPHPDIRNGEDMAVIPLMIMESKVFGFVEKPIYNYFCRPGSLSLSANENVVRSLERSFAHISDNQLSGYETEVEYIGIKNVVYGALLNHFKYSCDKKRAMEILARFEEKYPVWHRNRYISRLPIYKRFFVFLARARCFTGIRILCAAHTHLIEKEMS